MSVSKADLFKKRVKEQDIEIPGVGTVRVRALTREQVLKIKMKGEIDVAEMERKLISMGMVDPELTEEEVGQWQAVAPAEELTPITEAVMGMSGVSQELAKEAMKQFRN